MGRKPKYEHPESIIQAFMESVSDSYRHPGCGDEVGDVPGRKKQALLAEEFGVSRIKIRKILITTGDLVYSETKRIEELLAEGEKIEDVAEKMQLSISCVNSLRPYTKGVYKLSEVSAAADRTQHYRNRLQSIQELQAVPSSVNLWKTVCLFSGYPFITSGRGAVSGKKFKYFVAEAGGNGGRHYDGEEVEGFGNEIFIIPATGEGKGMMREKGISRSSVDYAFKIALEGDVTGPKKLKVYGASYVYALFKRFGLITSADAN